MKAFVGFLWVVIIIGSGVVLARRERRSGDVQSYGHPVKDNLLLLVSGIVLAGAMFAAFWWVDPLVRDPVLAKNVLALPLLAVAAAITWLANRALRR
jgi:hypothetical protein